MTTFVKPKQQFRCLTHKPKPMNINELQSEDVLAQVSLDDIKGGNTEAIGGCCALNFATNSSGEQTANSNSETSQSRSCILNFGPDSRIRGRRKRKRRAKRK